MPPYQGHISSTIASNDGMSLPVPGFGRRGGADGALRSDTTAAPTAGLYATAAVPCAPVQRTRQSSSAGDDEFAPSRTWKRSSGLPDLPRTTRLLTSSLPQHGSPSDTPFAWIPGSVLNGLFETADVPFPSSNALRRYLETCLSFTARNGGLLEVWGPGEREPAAYVFNSGFGDRRTTHTLFIVLERNHGRRNEEPASRFVAKYVGQDQLVWSSPLLRRIGCEALAEGSLPQSPQAVLRALASRQDPELRNWMFDPTARLPNELSTTLHSLSRSSERLGLGPLSTATLQQMIDWSLWRCRCTPSLAVPQWCPRFNSVQLLLPIYRPDAAVVEDNLPAEAGDEDCAVGSVVLQQEGSMYRVATILKLAAAAGNARLAMPLPPRWLRGGAGAAAYRTTVAHEVRGKRAGSSDSEDTSTKPMAGALAADPAEEPASVRSTVSTPPFPGRPAAVGFRLGGVAAPPGFAASPATPSVWSAGVQPQPQGAETGGSLWNALMLPNASLPNAPVQHSGGGAGAAHSAPVWGAPAPADGRATGLMGFALPPGGHAPTPPPVRSWGMGSM